MRKLKYLAINISALLALSFFAAIIFLTDGETQEKNRKQPPDILIIYTSGTPHETISGMDSKDADAVTCPTPVKENMRTVTDRLGRALRSKNLKVRVKRAVEINNRSEILDAGLVVLGSPSYFGNMSWQMKKLIDEKFGAIYASGKERLGRRKVAAFSMAEVEPSARETIRTIERAIRDCRGVKGPAMTVLTKHSEEEIDSRIQEFAGKIADMLK